MTFTVETKKLGTVKVDAVEAPAYDGCDMRVVTTICLRTKRGMFCGVSNCEPNDEYDQKLGYEAAMERALDLCLPNLPLQPGGMCANYDRHERKHERRTVWQALLERIGGC